MASSRRSSSSSSTTKKTIVDLTDDDDDDSIAPVPEQPEVPLPGGVVIRRDADLMTINDLPIIVLPLALTNNVELFERRCLARHKGASAIQEMMRDGNSSGESHAWMSQLLNYNHAPSTFMTSVFGFVNDWNLTPVDMKIVGLVRMYLQTADQKRIFITLSQDMPITNKHMWSLLEPVCIYDSVIEHYMRLLDVLHGTDSLVFGSLAMIPDPRDITDPVKRAIENIAGADNSWLARFVAQGKRGNFESDNSENFWRVRCTAIVAVHLNKPFEHYTILRLQLRERGSISIDAFDSADSTAIEGVREVYGRLVKILAIHSSLYILEYQDFPITLVSQKDNTSCGLFAMLTARALATPATELYIDIKNHTKEYRSVIFMELMRQRVPLYRPAELSHQDEEKKKKPLKSDHPLHLPLH